MVIETGESSIYSCGHTNFALSRHQLSEECQQRRAKLDRSGEGSSRRKDDGDAPTKGDREVRHAGHFSVAPVIPVHFSHASKFNYRLPFWMPTGIPTGTSLVPMR